MIIKVKDDNKYNYKGFSIQYQGSIIKVYRNNEYYGTFETEPEAEKFVDEVLEKEKEEQEKHDRRISELIKLSKAKYIVYKPQMYVYNQSRQNLYRLKNGGFKFSYEKDADKYTEYEADEIITENPSLRKVKVSDDDRPIYTVVYVNYADQTCEYYVKANSEVEARKKAERELKRRDKKNKIIEVYQKN